MLNIVDVHVVGSGLPPDPFIVLRLIGPRGSSKLQITSYEEAKRVHAALGELLRSLEWSAKVAAHETAHAGVGKILS